MSKEYLGKWVKQKGNDGDYEVIEVIDTDGIRAFVKGPQNKPISLSELGTTWVRMDSIIADPFASPDLAALKSADPSLKASLTEEELAEEMSIIKTVSSETRHESPYIEAPTKEVSKEVVFEATNPDEIAIEAIIKASKQPAKIKVSLEVEVPIDLKKLLQVANTLSINNDVAAGVVSKMMKLDQTEIHKVVSEAILKEMLKA